MSFRCKVLVRAANRRVKTLAITYWDEVEVIKKEISKFSLSCNPSMQLTSGEPFPDYPAMTDRLSQWNCLRLKLDTPNIEQIVYVFSAVTDLKLIVRSNDQIESLLHLLSHPQWTGQLSNLLFHNYCDLSPELASRLITAINGLSALQHLAIKFGRGEAEIPGLSTLTILAQLKTITVEFGDKCVRPFLRSLERNATENVNLQVHLFAEDNDALFSLSEPFRNQIVRYGRHLTLNYTSDNIPLLCSQFSFLTYLFVFCTSTAEIGPLFTALSQLQQLVCLNLGLVDAEDHSEDELLPLPLTQLPSVRALDLTLVSNNHSTLQWLNLSWTLPNCQAIHFRFFGCLTCKVNFSNAFINRYLTGSVPIHTKALECYRKAALHKLHRGVHLKKIILAMEKLPLDQLPTSYHF